MILMCERASKWETALLLLVAWRNRGDCMASLMSIVNEMARWRSARRLHDQH